MNCSVGHRHGSDLVLLWLWCRLEAVVSIRPLAWEPPYAMGVALKRKKKKKSMALLYWEWIETPMLKETIKRIITPFT